MVSKKDKPAYQYADQNKSHYIHISSICNVRNAGIIFLDTIRLFVTAIPNHHKLINYGINLIFKLDW